MVDAETLFELLHMEMVSQMYNPNVENAEVVFRLHKLFISRFVAPP